MLTLSARCFVSCCIGSPSGRSRHQERKSMKPIRALLAGLAVICSGETLALGGLADFTVYDRTEARRLPVYWHQGRAYVAGKPGNEYQITLRSLREGVLAVVSVDGVNVITGETANPAQSGYVLGARASLDIQ